MKKKVSVCLVFKELRLYTIFWCLDYVLRQKAKTQEGSFINKVLIGYP